MLESTADDGIVIALIAPVVAKLSLATVEIITEYPFGDTVTITVDLTTTVTKTEQQGVAASGTPVHIRIPGWATKATVDGSPAKNGTLHSVVAKAGGKSTFKIDFSPEVRVETGWGSNGVSIEGAESVQNGFARFQGALLAGGDLHSGKKWTSTLQRYHGRRFANFEDSCMRQATTLLMMPCRTAIIIRTALPLPPRAMLLMLTKERVLPSRHTSRRL